MSKNKTGTPKFEIGTVVKFQNPSFIEEKLGVSGSIQHDLAVVLDFFPVEEAVTSSDGDERQKVTWNYEFAWLSDSGGRWYEEAQRVQNMFGAYQFEIVSAPTGMPRQIPRQIKT